VTSPLTGDNKSYQEEGLGKFEEGNEAIQISDSAINGYEILFDAHKGGKIGFPAIACAM
jgi:hypothetical protein